MFLEASTKEQLTQYAEACSKFNLEQIALINKQICDATNHRLNYGLVLTGLIQQANKFESFEDSAKFTAVKNKFDLFIVTLTTKK